MNRQAGDAVAVVDKLMYSTGFSSAQRIYSTRERKKEKGIQKITVRYYRGCDLLDSCTYVVYGDTFTGLLLTKLNV